jgi:hypothetical protein
MPCTICRDEKRAEAQRSQPLNAQAAVAKRSSRRARLRALRRALLRFGENVRVVKIGVSFQASAL